MVQFFKKWNEKKIFDGKVEEELLLQNKSKENR